MSTPIGLQLDFPEQLPISSHVEEITEAIENNQVVIVAGETGSGKTTQLPKICLAMGRGTQGQIGHTQPRRLAARTVAERIAEELNVKLGEEVGYQVRFDDRSSAKGLIKLMTDGILLNELHRDPLLRKYDTLIIDEAHERSLNIDFILGILHQVLVKRADLKVIITSATIDPGRFSDYYHNAPIIEVSGRTFPVETRYLPLIEDSSDTFDTPNTPDTQNAGAEALTTEQAIFQAAEELMMEGDGDILVFLPGERDIRNCADYLIRRLDNSAEVLPLYARLAHKDQMKIFSRNKSGRANSQYRTRIVLATNIAETSLTVPGIHYVIDSGLARISRYSVRSKVQRLPIESISRASANQRQGRCGRIADGICIRLYSEDDFLGRGEFTDPEIKRTNLASVILQMAMLDLGAVEDFNFLDPPEQKVIGDGYKLLQELGAMTASRKITKLGRRLAVLPVDPKLGRILVAGIELDCLNEMLIITSAMSLPDPRERPIERQQQADEKHRRFADQDSDFVAILNLWNYFSDAKKDKSWNQLRKVCIKEFINFNRMREWREIYGQLKRLMTDQKVVINERQTNYEVLHQAVLSGLVSQIGEKTVDGDYQSTRQNRFNIFPGSGLFQKKKSRAQQDEQQAALQNNSQSQSKKNNQQSSRSMKWLLAGELVETHKLYGRQLAKIDPAWLESMIPNLLKHQFSDPYWSRKAARAMVKENISLYGLIIIANRPKPLAQNDAQSAYDLFIQHALIEHDFDTRASALLHNRQLLEQVEALEHRARRRDILIEQDYLRGFYEQRIPAKINNGQAFEHWYHKLSEKQQENLQLSMDDLIKDDAEDIDRSSYPETIHINHLELQVAYHFEPGAVDDGLHIILPIGFINQFIEDDFAWLVPGMLEEKIIALIRGLPKAIRKKFVPVPDYAKAVIEGISQHQTRTKGGSLLEQLSSILKNMSGINIVESDFNRELLADNLKPYFILTKMDSEHVIEAGRNYQDLQNKFSKQALDFLVDAVDDVELKTFDEYPEDGFKVSSSDNNLGLLLYQGLSLVDKEVTIRTFDNIHQAELSTADGLKRLLLNQSKKSHTDLKRYLPELSKSELLYFSLDPTSVSEDSEEMNVDYYGHIYQQTESMDLYQDLYLLVCDDVIQQQALSYDTKEQFSQLQQSIKKSLLPEITEHIKLVLEVFHQAENLRSLLNDNINKLSSKKSNKKRSVSFEDLSKLKAPEFKNNILERLHGLIFRGFLSQTGWTQLHELPRYLKGLQIRYDRAEQNPHMEEQRQTIWIKWWNKFKHLEQTIAPQLEKHKQLIELRWLMEEFHISLFAQQLGTKKSVSEKKLKNIMDEFG